MQLISGLIQISMLKITNSIDIVLDYDITLLKRESMKSNITKTGLLLLLFLFQQQLEKNKS